MGSIYRRGKVYWIKYYHKGKQIRESSRSDKKEVAKRLLKSREGVVAEGKLPGIYFDKVEVQELLCDCLTDQEVNKRKSIVRTNICCAHLSQFFGAMKVPQVTSAKINEYIHMRMGEGAKNATINRELAVLKRSFNLAARCTPPKVSAIPHIPMLKANNVRQGFFERDEFLVLRDALPHDLKPVATFAYCVGWRKSEILNLTWDRIDLNEGIVRLEAGETKNDAPRTLCLDGQLRELFKGQRRNRRLGCPYVFHRDGKKIKRPEKAWDAACQKAKVGHKLFHDLRRTAVRNMVRAGIPERVAMMVSGHKTRSVFDRYNIVSLDDLKLAASKISSHLAGTVTGTVDDSWSATP